VRHGQGELSRAQTTSLYDLAREQKALQGETQTLAGNLSAAEVFQMVLRAAAGEMGRAGASLDRRQTGVVTQQAQQNALASLGQLLDALKPDPPDERQGESGGAGGGQGNKTRAPGNQAIQNYAQLKLLRMLQDDVNRRTRELDKQACQGSAAGPELRRQSAAISEDQGRLAKLVMSLIQPEEDPEAGDVPPEGQQPNDAQDRQKPSGKEDTR